MARSGVYKWDVQRARDVLRAQGKNPSIDAVRTALGDTGSKSTIHKYLRELEQEDAAAGVSGKTAVSDSLQALVLQLAEQLHREAEATVAEARTAHAQELEAERQSRALVQAERDRIAEELQNRLVELAELRERSMALALELQAAQRTQSQLEERCAAGEQRLSDRDQQIASLEDKHRQAREALEHFRAAAKEQRADDMRRHDHALQGLQLELRQAAETIAAKNQEILVLNRDNGRLAEYQTQVDRELRTVRAELATARERLRDQDALVAEHAALESRAAALLADRARLEEHIASLTRQVQRETEAREAGELLRHGLEERFQGVEALLRNLRPRAKASRARSSTVPGESRDETA